MHQHSIFAHVCQDNGVVAHVEQGRLVIVLSAVLQDLLKQVSSKRPKCPFVLGLNFGHVKGRVNQTHVDLHNILSK